MLRYCLILWVFCMCIPARAQYASQAGLSGSTALHFSSSLFTGWATGCTVQRGYMDIANPTLGFASAGDSSLAIGEADDQTVSLGDSGVADLTFQLPICNGDGPDFAVFENGFLNTANDSLAFLELGFVEVSSDGVHYFRFPATSLTQDKTQISNDDYLYANQLNNLAGSYIALWGTPFDLQELAGITGLDINRVTHVRVVDVIGCISGHSSFDSAGRVVNDPYPTPYPSCGFDLDAVGVINQVGKAGVGNLPAGASVAVFPNPCSDKLHLKIDGGTSDYCTATISTVTGQELIKITVFNGQNDVDLAQLPGGIYFLELTATNGSKWVGKVIKH